MRTLLLILMLMVAPLSAAKPGDVIDLESKRYGWMTSFQLVQIMDSWVIFSCVCDYPPLTNKRICVKKSTIVIRYGRGQILTASGKHSDQLLRKMRYLGTQDGESLDGFPLTMYFYEGL
jgi:hypothetical protein